MGNLDGQDRYTGEHRHNNWGEWVACLLFAGTGLAHETGPQPELQTQIDMIPLVQDNNNALDTIRELIGNSSEHEIEIAEVAAGLLPDLADLIVNMLANTKTVNTGFPAYPPEQTGKALWDYLSDRHVKKRPSKISIILLDTLENPNVASTSGRPRAIGYRDAGSRLRGRPAC